MREEGRRCPSVIRPKEPGGKLKGKWLRMFVFVFRLFVLFSFFLCVFFVVVGRPKEPGGKLKGKKATKEYFCHFFHQRLRWQALFPPLKFTFELMLP